MWRSKYIFIFSLFFSLATNAQLGNEWINFDQSYYKIKIVKDDFYRITQQELQAVGFPASTINAEKIQLFRRGEEVAIRVNATNNVLNYLEFYGEKNDGRSDRGLYDEGDQPHMLYSLFSDTATYFLTYSLSANETGKRMAFSADKNTTGLTLESYHLEDSLQLFTSSYATGIKFGPRAEFSLSKYDNGEGWTGGFQSKNAFKDFAFKLENHVSGINPTLELVISGGNSLDHNAQISVGPDNSSLAVIDNLNFSGWGSMAYSGEIDESLIGTNGELNVRVLAEGFTGAAERFAVAYVRVFYPQTTFMQSEGNKIFTIDNPSTDKSWMRIQTSDPVNTDVFDISDTSNPILLAKTNSVANNYVEVVIPDVTNRHQVLATSTTASVSVLEPFTFRSYDFENNNYLIITHSLLRKDGDPVNDYEVYRESTAGGGFEVLTINVNDIYDLFNFGDPSPLGISKLIRFHSSVSELNHVFLIGKGFTPVLKESQQPDKSVTRLDSVFINVPTFGFPGSDLMYTLGIGTDARVPGLPIGRLNALKTSDVTAYLNKVVEMEALPYDDLWRKDFLQLSGGSTDIELVEFANYINDFTDVIEEDFIGGRAFNTGKKTDRAVEYIDIANRVNEGVGYITFFGHSGGNSTDIEIGEVSQTNFGFSNKGKYPLFLVNGCKAGEIFGNNVTFGEDWINTPNLGSVGLIAHADVALSSTLKDWSDLFYDIGFANQEFIGKTVGEVMIEVSKNYFSSRGASNLNLTQLQQMQLQGDPAYRIFGADHPDYTINTSSTIASAIDGGQILSTQDSMKISIVVKNFGKTTSDSLKVKIDRILADGAQYSYEDKFERPLRQDSIEFFIPLDRTLVNDGINTFIVRLDPDNAIEELNEMNNTISIQVPIFAGSTFNLFPIDNGTQAASQVQFIWQSSNVNEETRSYDLELDTQADFMGSNKRTFQQTGNVLLRQDVDLASLSLTDSATIYWRTRFTNPASNESGEWVENSFTLINNVADGWGQYEEEQISSGFVSGVEFDEMLNQWTFKESENPIEILTYGFENTAFQNDGTTIIEAIVGGVNLLSTSNIDDPFCEVNTFNAIVFDRESGDAYQPNPIVIADELNDEICGRLPQRIYQFRETDLLDAQRRLTVLVDNMQTEDRIVLFNMGNVNYSLWDAE
ncbi:MAG: C25 family cysteine peptidase, partial [Ekhidna sp.]